MTDGGTSPEGEGAVGPLTARLEEARIKANKGNQAPVPTPAPTTAVETGDMWGDRVPADTILDRNNAARAANAKQASPQPEQQKRKKFPGIF